jgi:hypothetical protein
MSEVRHLIVTDSLTGEVYPDGCPACKQYENQLRTANAKITRLETSDEEKARQHKRWDEAEAAFTWWALATGHEGVAFEAEEFGYVVPRLKEKSVGLIGVLQAIAGAAFDPGSRPRKNGTTEVYDDFELINRSKKHARSFRERAPGWPVSEHKWKAWLIDRIESQFKEAGE